MSHETPRYFPAEAAQTSAERPVLVSGRFLGREVQSLSLADLMPSQLGSSGYKEALFETISGNIYRIYLLDNRRLAVVDAKSNKGRGHQPQGVVILANESHNLVLRVGAPFTFGNGSTTSKVLRITALTSKQFSARTPNRETTNEIARRETEGNISDIQERFDNYLRSKTK